jgi:hypothetical protein
VRKLRWFFKRQLNGESHWTSIGCEFRIVAFIGREGETIFNVLSWDDHWSQWKQVATRFKSLSDAKRFALEGDPR